MGYLAARDEAGHGRIMSEGMSPFARDPEAAKATADAVMAAIRSEPAGRPAIAGRRRAGAAALRAVAVPTSGRARALRIAGFAAAALLVAVLSSVATLGIIRSGSTVNVRFVLIAPEASSVWLAADFNEWSPEGYELERSPDGSWEITVPLKKGKAYAYNFIIDGERWIADPSSRPPLDDGFGGSSSSLSL